MIGKEIQCATCAGKGVRAVWSRGVLEPDECPDCGGSGTNWQYPNGAIARYYSGPLLGRLTKAELAKTALHGVEFSEPKSPALPRAGDGGLTPAKAPAHPSDAGATIPEEVLRNASRRVATPRHSAQFTAPAN